MSTPHTVIEELEDTLDKSQFDAKLDAMLIKLGSNRPELLLECVMSFLQRKTRLLSTSTGRDKADAVLSNYIKRSSSSGVGNKPLQAGFFGKSAAVASPTSRPDTLAEKQVGDWATGYGEEVFDSNVQANIHHLQTGTGEHLCCQGAGAA